MQSTALNPTQADSDLAVNDLGPLAWVLNELRKSLDSATKALKRFVRDAEAARGLDLSAIDASQLRIARQQLHQAVGALEMVGLGGPALVLRAMEAAVQRFVQYPEQCNQDAAAKIERASFALTEYLEAVLADKPISAVSLFPQYRAVQELVRADRIHPADLWPYEWRWLEPELESIYEPQNYDDNVRTALDQSILRIMKGQVPQAAENLKALCLGFSAGQTDRQARIFWKISAAFFEALAHQLIAVDIYARRAASRVLLQYASWSKGDHSVSDRLAHDLLFFCAQAVAARTSDAPVLSAVRAAYGLARFKPVDYEAVQFGRFDPALLAQARKRIVSAKETWSSLSAGDVNKFKLVVDQFSLVSDTLVKLHPPCKPLAQALSRAADMTARSGQVPAIELAMEVATSVLYLEAALGDLDPRDPQLDLRMVHLAERLERVRTGGEPQPLEAWMEDLYRRVSDKQTMGSVVGELRLSLGDLEKSLDLFFRNPKNKTVLQSVPGQLSQMRGVLSVLGLEQASQAVSRMRESVEQMLLGEDSATNEVAGDNEVEEAHAHLVRTAGTFDQLGNNLGALSFLIDMLNYQPALAKKLFVYDDEKGELRPLMGRTNRPDDAGSVTISNDSLSLEVSAVVQDVDAGTSPEKLTEKLDALITHAALAGQSALAKTAHDALVAVAEKNSVATAQAMTSLASSLTAPTAELSDPNEAVDFEEDDLRDIFLEEAREVAGNGQEALRGLASEPTDIECFATLRRVFHTLKGSSRMVGLNQFGDAAWSMEQMLNSLLADQKPATDSVRTLATDALSGFSKWIEAIAAGQDAGWSAAPFLFSADAMRLEERFVPLHLPAPFIGLPAQTHADEAAVMDAPVSAANAITESAMLVELTELPISVPLVELNLTPSVSSDDPEVVDFDLFFAEELPAALPNAGVLARSVSLNDEVVGIDFDSLSALSGIQGAVDAWPEALPLSTFDLSELEVVTESDPDPVKPGAATGITSQDDGLNVAELSAADFEEPFFMPANAIQPNEVVTSLLTESLSAEPVFEVAPAVRPESMIAVNDLDDEIETSSDSDPDDQIKMIGALRIGIPLYNVYLNEADEWSRRLVTEVSEWAMECHHPIGDSTVALAHSLAGSSATVGFVALSNIARAFEHALQRSQAHHSDSSAAANVGLFIGASEDIRRLLHQFAAGFLKEADASIFDRLRTLEFADSTLVPLVEGEDVDFLTNEAMLSETNGREALQAFADGTGEVVLPLPPVLADEVEVPVTWSLPAEPTVSRSVSSFESFPEDAFVHGDDDEIDAVDAIDPELFPIFDEEAAELMPQLGGALRQWSARPDNQSARNEVMRALHTLKGSARLAGALRLGEMAHRIESDIEYLGSEAATAQDFEALLTRFDLMEHTLVALRRLDNGSGFSTAYIASTTQSGVLLSDTTAEAVLGQRPVQYEATVDLPPAALTAVVALAAETASSGRVMIPAPQTMARGPLRQAASASIRVRSQLLDRMVNQAGEVMITRSRLEVELGQLRSSLGDMTGNLNRLRQQLRDIELQAETQMQSRLAQAKELQAGFDPLEFDRFTRVQELTRMMAESVNDVATVQRTLQRTVEATEDDLIAQARQTRELQRDLLRTRMVEFEGISDRLYRVVRLASKETGKKVRLDLLGGTIEMDRGMLDRMTPAFEHLLRNCVAHGIESPQVRMAAGKDPIGLITVHLRQEGNDVSVEFSDDGAGLDLQRIREKAQTLGLVEAGQILDDQQAANMIFMPGFTTASYVTELAGRGIGMDVVRSEVNGVGGRIETSTAVGQGTQFKLVLPLTTAVTQVVMVRAGNMSVGVPANVVETVRRVTAKELQQAYNTGVLDVAGEQVSFFWSGALLQSSHNTSEAQTKTSPVVVFRSAAQRIAMHVDEVLGNQEVVVKNLGPQLSRLPGLAGMSVLASGAVVLIYNPVALAAIYAEQARALSADRAEPHMLESVAGETSRRVALVSVAPKTPLILVVDDSITVRRVTQRLLQREGYRVALAADGLQALERLQEERPTVVLSDIEMPRMDGFDLARNIRADPRLSDLPIVMITSRIAGKHREHAKELGVDHYLGKPYSEDELMNLVRHYCSEETAVS